MSLLPISSETLADPEMSRWFTEEVQPHEPALRNWLRARYPKVSDRDDLVQESYMRLWRVKVAGPVGSPKALLFVIARNLALNHLRRLRRIGEIEEKDFSEVLDDKAGVSDQVARKQEFELLNEVIHSLPERCREVFVLRRFYGMSQKEIAARLGISEKTVEAQNVKAIRQCREFFQELERAERPVPMPAQPAALTPFPC